MKFPRIWRYKNPVESSKNKVCGPDKKDLRLRHFLFHRIHQRRRTDSAKSVAWTACTSDSIGNAGNEKRFFISRDWTRYSDLWQDFFVFRLLKILSFFFYAEDRMINFCKNKLSIHVQIIITIFLRITYVLNRFMDTSHFSQKKAFQNQPFHPMKKKTTTVKTLNNDYGTG